MLGFYLMEVSPARATALVRGVPSSPETPSLILRMLSVLRITTPVTLKLSPLGKRAALPVVLNDASNSPAGPAIPSDHLPPICHVQEAKPLTTDIQRLPLVERPLPNCDVSSDTGNRADSDTSRDPVTTNPSFAPIAYPSSISFPVVGPFDLLYCIQNGAFGDAWAAKDRSTGRLLCLKVFQPLKDPDVARSVHTELRMFRRMVKSKAGERGKQFIMELSRSIQHDATVFFAMELMTTDLGTYMYTNPERCEMHARWWMAQIALGIGSLHEMGILHRDIKSENILIDSRENVRIIDFGLSYMNSTCKPLRQGCDYATEFVGTPSYMAPEVLRNNGIPIHQRTRYGIAVDWWALGCILFELESRDHQILFDTEEDVGAYVTWTQKRCQREQIYPRFDGLDPAVLNLLEGLLQVQPTNRHTLSDMEKHDYFLHRNGASEFDDAAVRAMERPVRPELVPQVTEDEPTEVVEAAKLTSIYDWTNLKWAHFVNS